MALTQVRPAGLETLPSGSILQVQYTQYITATSVSNSANTDTAIDELAVNITPKFSDSIIKLEGYLSHEHSNVNFAANAMTFFFRGSTKLSPAAASNRRVGIAVPLISYHQNAGSTIDGFTLTWFDNAHNTTSQITYKIGFTTLYAGTMYINRTVTDTDSNEYERGASYISATEIKA